MPGKVPDEVLVARLSIEAARVALEALFEKMQATRRSEKVMVSETVHEAVVRLKAAQSLLSGLETETASDSERPPKV